MSARPHPAAPPQQDRLDAQPALRVALAGVALTTAALTFGAAPLLVPGVAFLVLGCACVAWVAWTAGRLRVSHGDFATRVVEGQPLEVSARIVGAQRPGRSRRRRLPHTLRGVDLHHAFAAGPVSLSGRRPRRALDLMFSTTARGRGRVRIGQPWLTVSDPLGLARAIRVGEGGSRELLVLPRTEPVRWVLGRSAGGARVRSLPFGEPSGAGDLDGLRPYRDGAPATRIHWPALARGAGLQELLLVEDAPSIPVIVLDPRTEPGAEGTRQLDAAVRAAASLALDLGRRGGVRVMLPGVRGPLTVTAGLAGWPNVHVALALVAPGAPQSPPPVLPQTSRGLLIYVSTGVAQVATRRWNDGLLLVAPVTAEPGPDTVLQVAGCAGRLVRAGGYRSARSLPMAVRRRTA